MEFSAKYRSEYLHKLKQEQYDLVVIGGGITGCGIALDAASRGLKVALLEKNDFAFGTSSRSTKLIHGGLRYLKQLEFGLVKEVGSERAVVHNLAPHLVVPEKMLLPLYEKKGLGYWLTSFGLKIYDWLAGVKPEDQRRMLTKAQTLKAEPLLKQDDVKGGALYAEYRTDDARLTIEIAKAAVDQGAVLLNYAGVTGFIDQDGRIAGVNCIDTFSQESFSVRARVVVNAAGPWVDELRAANKSLSGKKLHLTKGVHIVVPRARLPVKQAIYFDVDDGRMIFAIPRGRVTYIGTTDTSYNADKNHVVTTGADATYLINAVNNTFPTARLTMADIESSWAGLRPLIHEEGKSESELSRKDEIFESSSGLISIAGGKLTGYRKMSERVVNLVLKKYMPGTPFRICMTDKIKLARGGFSSYAQVRALREKISERLALFGFEQSTVDQLVENFGAQTPEIINDFLTLAKEGDREFALLKAQLKFCIAYEAVQTLADFLVRRTGLLYFDICKVLTFREDLASEMAILMGWDPSRKLDELATIQELLSDAQLKNPTKSGVIAHTSNI